MVQFQRPATMGGFQFHAWYDPTGETLVCMVDTGRMLFTLACEPFVPATDEEGQRAVDALLSEKVRETVGVSS